MSLTSFVASQPGQNGFATGLKAGIYTGAHSDDLPGPMQFTVTNDVSKTTEQLTDMYNEARKRNPYISPLPPGQVVGGLTTSFSAFLNYTASDVDPSKFLYTQIKELGNSLGILTHQPIEGNNAGGYKEPGDYLRDCYRGTLTGIATATATIR